jgi:hypothetical protein
MPAAAMKTLRARSRRARFVEGNLELALSEDPRPGAERKLTGKEEALLGATACANPPASVVRNSEIQGFGATTTRRVATATLRLHDAGLRSGCASSRRCNGESNCCKTYHVTGGREKNDAYSPPANVPSRNSTLSLVDRFGQGGEHQSSPRAGGGRR